MQIATDKDEAVEVFMEEDYFEEEVATSRMVIRQWSGDDDQLCTNSCADRLLQMLTPRNRLASRMMETNHPVHVS